MGEAARPRAREVSMFKSERATRVLVVEDDEAVRDSLCAYLETLGYGVTCAADAKTALEEIRRSPPAVAVIDLTMPGMDGIELMGELPSWEAGFPIIAISGGHPRLLEMARNLGAVEAFAKPFDTDVFAIAVARCAAQPAKL
jgi:CheY-like chemotaxis protein